MTNRAARKSQREGSDSPLPACLPAGGQAPPPAAGPRSSVDWAVFAAVRCERSSRGAGLRIHHYRLIPDQQLNADAADRKQPDSCPPRGPPGWMGWIQPTPVSLPQPRPPAQDHFLSPQGGQVLAGSVNSELILTLAQLPVLGSSQAGLQDSGKPLQISGFITVVTGEIGSRHSLMNN